MLMSSANHKSQLLMRTAAQKPRAEGLRPKPAPDLKVMRSRVQREAEIAFKPNTDIDTASMVWEKRKVGVVFKRERSC